MTTKYTLAPRQSKRQPKRAKRNLTFSQYVTLYFEHHDTGDNYRKLIISRCRSFCSWLGSDIAIAKLDCDIVNEYVQALMAAGAKPHTADGHRRAIRAVWFFAYQSGDNEHPPLRLKPVKTPRTKIEAFKADEIAKMLAHVATLRTWFPNGVTMRDFWQAAILSAYSTGLRRSDLLGVKRSDIAENGVAIIVQQKTGYTVAVKFSDDALVAINRMAACSDDDPYRDSRPDRALPWPFHPNALSRQFREIAKAAGVRPGQFRWLRRSAGSYAELQQPGNGSRLLGHRCESVFRCHYEDETITTTKAVEPPTIVLPSIVAGRKAKGGGA